MLPSHFKTSCDETSGALMLRMLIEKGGRGAVGIVDIIGVYEAELNPSPEYFKSIQLKGKNS